MNQIQGFNFTGSGNDGDHEDECDGHGTCVASCVSGILNNGLGSMGIAPSTRTVGMKIFNSVSFFGFCLGFLESQDSWTVAGLNQAQAIDAKITNSSWGGGAASSVVNAAFDSTRAAGVLHVAAAGNDGSTNISWPASHGSLLAVSALSSNGNLASFSTSGNGLFASALPVRASGVRMPSVRRGSVPVKRLKSTVLPSHPPMSPVWRHSSFPWIRR